MRSSKELIRKEESVALAEDGQPFEVGQLYIGADHYAKLVRIREIKLDHYTWEKNEDGESVRVMKYKIFYDVAEDWEGTSFRSYGSEWPDAFERKYSKVEGSLEELMAKTNKLLETGDVSEFEEKEETQSSSSTAVMAMNSKDSLSAIAGQLEVKRRKAEMMERAVQYEMAKRKAELEVVRSKLGRAVSVMMKKVEKIMKVIATIELYLGIHEELFQITEGEPTSKDEPICFRQQLLYMDEEYGDPTDGGMDFRNIDQFDNWVADNIDKLMPEKKGVLIMNARRKNRVYDKNNPFLNAMMNKENRRTYYLIRNGENIYRINSNIHISDRLFPRKADAQKLMDKLQGLYQKKADGESIHESDLERADEEMFHYQKRMIFLQGLIDRTQVFHPIHENLSLFKLDEAGDLIRFIYDDDMQLPTGRLPFWDWVREINSTLERGMRVVHSGVYSADSGYSRSAASDWSDRWFKYYNEYNYPSLPHSGIYNLVETKRQATEIVPHWELSKWERHKDTYDWETAGFYSDKWLYNTPEEKAKWKKEADMLALDDKEIEVIIKQHHKTDMTTDPPTHTTVEKAYVKHYKVYYYERVLVIRYNPEDEVYSGWGDWRGHTRKNNLSFIIKPYDRFILNYEGIKLEDVEFYIESRVDRHNYSEMLPLLYLIKRKKLEELADEKEFVKLMQGQIPKATEQDIWDAIEWWKMKVIEKRPLTKDDAKAFRMIQGRVKRFLKKKQ